MRELNALGLNASQRYQISEESYRSAQTFPARIWLRFRQYVFYPLRMAVALICGFHWQRRKMKDICVVSTNTFFAPLVATYLHPRVIHLVYDLFPEALIHSGKWREGSLKVRLARAIVGRTMRRSAKNVFLGKRLKEYVESIHGELPNASIISVGAARALFPGLRGSSEIAPAAPTVLYCGNFGNLHDSETLIGYWNSLADIPECNWKFHCSGPKRFSLKNCIENLSPELAVRISLGGGLKQEDWAAAMAAADLALVTMSPGAEIVVMPSKTYSAMMAGQAILAIAPENSDLVDLIKETDCGWWVEPGDVVGLEQTIREIIESPTTLRQRQAKAIQFAHENFGQEQLAKKWISLFEALGTKTD